MTEPAVDEAGEDAGASAEWRADALDALEGSPGEASGGRSSRVTHRPVLTQAAYECSAQRSVCTCRAHPADKLRLHAAHV